MKIKIIWDFRGDDCSETAKHHAIHLKEFCDNNNINYISIDTEKLNDFYSIAFIITYKENVMMIRDALKPHRAAIC